MNDALQPGSVPVFSISDGGWCAEARHLSSPNFDVRPPGIGPYLLLIHNISLPPGQFGGSHISGLFTNTLAHEAHPYFEQLRPLRVSAHFLISRDGAVTQFVGADARAWHAGASTFEGRERCNDFSIGIELEGSDFVPFEAAQYCSLTGLTLALQRRYPLRSVAGHEHVAPGRKTDPGPFFDWPGYRESCAKASTLQPLQFVMLT